MPADLDFQGSLDDDVDLLPLVGGELDVPPLGPGGVLRHDVEGLGNAVLEAARQRMVGHAVGFFDDLPLTAPGDGVPDQRGGFALDDVRHVDAEGEGAAVDEREGEVLLPAFAALVFLRGDVGLRRHFLGRISFDGAQFPDPGRHLADLEFQSCEVGLHDAPPPCGGQKNRPKDPLKCFETNDMPKQLSAVPLKLRSPFLRGGCASQAPSSHRRLRSRHGRILLTGCRFAFRAFPRSFLRLGSYSRLFFVDGSHRSGIGPAGRIL